MTYETTRYYEDLLGRVRKGKAPTEEEQQVMEMQAFDAVYTLSVMDRLQQEGRFADVPWDDKYLLDCGKLAARIAQNMLMDDAWGETQNMYDSYTLNLIKTTAENDKDGDLYGKFAYSEYVLLKKILVLASQYHKQIKLSARSKLSKMLFERLIGYESDDPWEL